MLYFTYFIHANLQYGEFPDSQVPEIVRRSYLPTLELFAAHPQLRAVFEFSGYSLERLASDWPEVIDLLRLLMERGQVELLASTLSNPILPLIPSDHARRQVLGFQQIYASLFGDLGSPAGVYLQEFAYDPTLAFLLKAAGYSYTILTPELLLAGLRRQLNSALLPPGPRTPAMKDLARMELLHPLTALGTEEARLAVFPFHRDLIDLIFDYSNGVIGFDPIADLLAALDAACSRTSPGFVIFGPSDAEFIGYYGYLNRVPITAGKLGELMSRVAELPFIRLGLPMEYLQAYPPQQEVYIPAGSSEPSFDIWVCDPDNQRLNDLCAEAAGKLQLAEALAPAASERASALLARAWRAMLLAENSDGRGWMPHPERRLFCYNQALHAIQLAEEILKLH